MIRSRSLPLAALAAALLTPAVLADEAAGDPAAQALAVSKQTGNPIVAVAGAKT